MAYVTITTWELDDGADWNKSLANVSNARLPALKAMGALRVTLIRTSDRTSAAITEWPDRATRDAAMHLVEDVRGKVQSVDRSRLTGEMKGEVVADV